MLMNSLSIMDKNIDTNKQLAYMRNYINQLKDEIESELSNISYDNLDADLRQRFDDMEKGLLTANNTTLEVAGVLKTQYLKADEIAAKYITAQTVAANYATIGSLNAVSASVLELSTSKLDATTAYIDFMEVRNWVSAGYIRADKIKSDELFSTQAKACTIYTDDIRFNHNGHWGIAGWKKASEIQSNYYVMYMESEII